MKARRSATSRDSAGRPGRPGTVSTRSSGGPSMHTCRWILSLPPVVRASPSFLPGRATRQQTARTGILSGTPEAERHLMERQARRAFTLIELVVVIALIFILAALLFPVF